MRNLKKGRDIQAYVPNTTLADRSIVQKTGF